MILSNIQEAVSKKVADAAERNTQMVSHPYATSYMSLSHLTTWEEATDTNLEQNWCWQCIRLV